MDDDRYGPPGSWLRTHSVRLIDSDGSDLGVVTIAEALRRASDAGLKIVEINTRVHPMVRKMMNAEQFDLHLRATQGSAN